MATKTSGDRHREGYFEEYAQKTSKKDRHREGYWADRAKTLRNRRKRHQRKYNKRMREAGYTLETEIRDGKKVLVWVKREVRTVDAVLFHLEKKENQYDFETAMSVCGDRDDEDDTSDEY